MLNGNLIELSPARFKRQRQGNFGVSSFQEEHFLIKAEDMNPGLYYY